MDLFIQRTPHQVEVFVPFLGANYFNKSHSNNLVADSCLL